jgi:predicted DNA-binding transcriptional regulator YafY
MEVSERTIYRDIADLQASGVPIDGAAGVGYIMRQGYDLPPLMFTNEEVSSLVLGARLVAAWGGTSMASAASEALGKIAAVLPKPDIADDARDRFSAPGYMMRPEQRGWIDQIDAAAQSRNLLQMDYEVEGVKTRRCVRPLALWFWGAKWTFIAWCELRGDFRMFRTDRIAGLTVLADHFTDDPDKTLAAFMEQLGIHPELNPSLDPLKEW